MKYKVRITKAPQSMAYGGQSNYGLDLGAKNVYSDMNQNPYDSMSDSLQPVDRSQANIEAERGETIVGDFNQDGQNEHMKVGGERHSQGGTPLAVPEGSFVFSDTKRMRIGGPVLSMFGKPADTKKKYTPAQLAKQYDVNKYKAILDDPYADDLSKRTAANMIKNFEMKLGGLALVQEAKKGFPQGIPNIAMPVLQTMMPEQGGDMMKAEYGGYYFDDGGEKDPDPKKKTPRTVSKQELDKLIKEGYTQVGNTNVWRKGSESREYKPENVTSGKPGSTTGGSSGSIIPGRTISGGGNWVVKGCENLLYTLEDIKARPGCYNTFLNKNGFKDASDDDKKKGLDEWKRGRRPTYKPGIPGTTDPGTKETRACPEGYVFDPNAPDPKNPCVFIKPEEDLVTTTDTPSGTTPYGRRPFFGKQFAIGPKRYTPYVAPLNAMIPYPTFYDPNRELAEAASQRKMMTEYMAGMDPQAFGARASALNAQGAEQSGNTIAKYQNMNVGVANQFSPLQTDIMNKLMAYRAEGADKLVWNGQQEDKAYRNSWKNYLRNLDMADIANYDYNTKMNMLNATNPYYNIIDRPGGGNIMWRPGVDVAKLISGQNAQASSSVDFTKVEAEAKRLKDEGHDAATINSLLRAKFPSLYSSGSSRNNLNAINQNYLGLRAPGQANGYNAYPFDQYGFDIEP